MRKRIVQKARRKIGHVKRKLTRGTEQITTAQVPARYSIDNPVQSTVDQKTVSVDGWIIPHKDAVIKALQVRHNDAVTQVPFGLKRVDVAKAFPAEEKALTSGFQIDIEVADGPLSIEVDFGQGFQVLHSVVLTYSPELLVGDLYNPDLAQNWAEQLNLMQNKTTAYYEEAAPGQYVRHKDDPRMIAFYLPQFHPIAENNHVWGEGFTEWTNVTGDTPRFVGHRQPILPKDTGFYDLRLEQNIADQIDRAKKHGIYGFCFYYYWFSGRRLLEQPLDSFIKHQEWDFTFTICWANENWTKRWDGRDSEVIVAQEYAEEDPLQFIKDVEHILLDPRYIREDDKPVLVVFRASELKQPERYAEIWRQYFRQEHKTELHLVSIVSFENKDPRSYGFDMALDFAPQSSFFKNDAFQDNRYPTISVSDKLIDKNFTGMVADYRTIALNEKTYNYFDFPAYKCVTPSWDNDARKKNKGFVMQNESPSIYGQWLDNILKTETQNNTSPMVFINAWNEWAEGAVLEPTMHYGSAVLNKTSEVLSKYSSEPANAVSFPAGNIPARVKGITLAVVVHLYHVERWPVIKERLALIDASQYDLFVTINIKDSDFTEEIRRFRETAHVQIVPNRGRDILPFLLLLPRLRAAGYTSLIKLHSKKTIHRENGDDWFAGMLQNLLPSKQIVDDTIAYLQNTTALIGPAGNFISLERYMGSNQPKMTSILKMSNGYKEAQKLMKQASKIGYFAGSMFWVSMAALEPIAKLYLLPEDFESEQGQIDGTTGHAVERLISVYAGNIGAELSSLSPKGRVKVVQSEALRQYPYAE